MPPTTAALPTERPVASEVEHLDVLIVGAGLSGIGAAHHLQERCPGRSYAILEARERLGGTWDLFRYPGIRSDSDMHTLGFRLRPWTEAKAIADGPAILQYVTDTAREQGIDTRIRTGLRVVRASWSTADARWSVEAERTDGSGEVVRLTCGFLFSCSGYYRYDEGFTPAFPQVERFAGPVVHPQHWPEDLDVTGRRVVVIGSGATAVTLVPALARSAAHVTMLQRSPSYVVTVPDTDPIDLLLRKVLPLRVVYKVTRWKNVLLQSASYRAARRWPGPVRKAIRWATTRQLPAGFEVDKHFRPHYDPWDQRMCMVPNGDLFKSIRLGKASVVTDHIEAFEADGIRLRSGEHLPADVVVTATGLNLLPFGGVDLTVDDERIDLPSVMAYKSLMLSGVPNFAFALGYTNASWTLKADLTSQYVCRLLNHMDARGMRAAVPERDPSVGEEPFLDFRAGYVVRALDQFPKQGSKAPWNVRMSYVRDLLPMRYGKVTDGMRFIR